MLPRSLPARHPEPVARQRALQQCVSDPAELVEALGLDEQWRQPATEAAANFPLRVPRSYLARLRMQRVMVVHDSVAALVDLSETARARGAGRAGEDDAATCITLARRSAVL